MRRFSLLVALAAALLLLNPGNGILHVLVWGQKLLAGAFSPFLAMFGALNAVAGFVRKDFLMLTAGMFSLITAAGHLLRVTAPQETSFIQAFGPQWLSRIPVRLRAQLAPYRWQLVAKRRPCAFRHKNVTYGTNLKNGKPLVADILRPPRRENCSGLAMIFVHGGGWWYGRKNICKFPYFRQMVSQGHLVMDIDYTLAPHSSVPEMVRELKQAILWLKTHAAEIGINPNKVVLAGQSAGAHLALLAAYTPNHPAFQPFNRAEDTSVQGVISYYGPSNMVALHNDIYNRFSRRLPGRLVKQLHLTLKKIGMHDNTLASGISAVVGGTPNEIPEVYRLISPTTYINKNCPPTLLFQGTHDLMVNHKDTEALYQTLRGADVPAVYIPFWGCDHSFESIFPQFSPSAQTAAYYTERFLALLV